MLIIASTCFEVGIVPSGVDMCPRYSMISLKASFWERSDRNGVSFPEEEGPDPSGVRPWAFALDEGIVT